MPIPFRRAVGPFALLILSGVLAVAFVVRWPQPISAVLAGAAGLCLTASMVALYLGAREVRAQLAQFRKAIFLQPGFFALVFLGIALKYRTILPAFSSASLISAGLFALGAVAAFFFTRSGDLAN